MLLIWINAESTVMVSRGEDGMTLAVAMRPDSDALWGPPIACRADAETAKVMAVAAQAADAAQRHIGPHYG